MKSAPAIKTNVTRRTSANTKLLDVFAAQIEVWNAADERSITVAALKRDRLLAKLGQRQRRVGWAIASAVANAAAGA